MNQYQRTKKSNTNWQLFFIAVIYACCVVKIWNTQQNTQDFLANNLFYFLYTKGFVYKLLISILLFINVFSIILFSRRFSLLELRNYYPAILYLLFSCMFAKTLTVWGMLTGIFVLWGIFPVLFSMNEKNTHPQIFMYGLFCGVLSLIYTPFLLLLSFIYIIFFKERLYAIRAFILPLIGAGLAYGYLFAGFYLLDQMDKIPIYFETVKMQLFDIHFFTSIQWSSMLVFFLIISVLLGFVSFFQIWWKLRFITITKRKKCVTLLILLFLQFIFLLFFHAPYAYLLNQVMIILLAIVIPLSMLYMKRAVIFKIIFFVLFLLTVGSLF